MKAWSVRALGAPVVVLFLAGWLFGCEGKPVAEQVPEASQDVDYIPFAMDESVHLVRLRAKGTEQEKAYVQRLYEEAYDATARAEQAAQESRSWMEADQQVRTVLAGIREHPLRQKIEQLAAHAMLTHRLLNGEGTPAKRDAIGFYTRLLIDNRNPDASIILPALQTLEGHWPKERIASSAQEASSLAAAWLKRNPCEDCLGLGKNIQADRIDDARTRRIYEIQEAVSMLSTMAQNP